MEFSRFVVGIDLGTTNSALAYADLAELAPIQTRLESPGKEGRTVPVRLHAHVTAIGTLELWCRSLDSKHPWKVEFNVRERDR